MYRPMISSPAHYLQVSGQLHAPADLPQGKSLRYLFDKRMGGPQDRSGWHRVVKILASPGLELQPLGRPARSQ
jgi:hypothetical protein